MSAVNLPDQGERLKGLLGELEETAGDVDWDIADNEGAVEREKLMHLRNLCGEISGHITGVLGS